MSNLSIDLAQMQGAPSATPSRSSRKFDEAASEFESVFITQMLQTVWDTVPTDGAMGGGMGESIFRSMMIQDIGRQVAQQGGIGLSSFIKAELIRIQEGRQ